jgi:hypothetical protein
MSIAQQRMSTPSHAADVRGKLSEFVSDYPMSSVLVVFGIGVAAGVALGGLLSGPVTSRPTLGRRTELAAEQLGRQMLDAIAGVLPASLAKHIAA